MDQVENACVLDSLCPVFREIATTRRLWFLNDVFHRVHFLGLLLFTQLFDAVEPSSVVETMPSVLKKFTLRSSTQSGAAYPLPCLTSRRARTRVRASFRPSSTALGKTRKTHRCPAKATFRARDIRSIRSAMKRPAQRITSELPIAIDFGAENLWLRSVQIGLPDLSARRKPVT